MHNVLQEAEELTAKRWKARMQDIQAAVQNGTAKAFGAK